MGGIKLGEGPYTERILNGGSFLTRLGHSDRFEKSKSLIGQGPFSNALDVGCADGYFLKELADNGVVKSGIGLDIDPEMLELCSSRFEDKNGFRFVESVQDKDSPFDLIVCSAVLEHMSLGEAKFLIRNLHRWLDSDGLLLVSVPVEHGLVLLVKQIGRWLANLRGHSYFYERYSWKELFQAGILNLPEKIQSTHRENCLWKEHKGFDYRLIEDLLSEYFVLETGFSPSSMLPSTIFWRAKKKCFCNP